MGRKSFSKIKNHQKLILNSINNEMPFDMNMYLDNNEIFKQLIEEVAVKSNSNEIAAQILLTKIDDNVHECELGKF